MEPGGGGGGQKGQVKKKVGWDIYCTLTHKYKHVIRKVEIS